VLVASHRQLQLLKIFFAAVTASLLWGCASTQKTAKAPAGAPVPRLTATKQDLITRFNEQASAVKSINASITMTLTAGSAYTGVIKQYHEVKGFILAQRPASVRVIGQAPIVGTNIFDMVSDGETFHIFIPSQHKFIEGPANLERASAKPIENLRPQHLTSALFWESIGDNAPVLFEEANEPGAQYYVLTVLRSGAAAEARSHGVWEIEEKIWFDRADLSVARLETYEPGGKLGSDVGYSGWDTFGSVKYARRISVSRPDNDYKLQIGIVKATMNEPISADRFALKQPPGTELVDVGNEPAPPKPADSNAPDNSQPKD
jgi:outer membrane lipoprotein-sorting protein